jgi:hypothetical protein
MFDLVIIGIFLALLGIGWEQLRIADLMEDSLRATRSPTSPRQLTCHSRSAARGDSATTGPVKRFF